MTSARTTTSASGDSDTPMNVPEHNWNNAPTEPTVVTVAAFFPEDEIPSPVAPADRDRLSEAALTTLRPLLVATAYSLCLAVPDDAGIVLSVVYPNPKIVGDAGQGRRMIRAHVLAVPTSND